MNCWKTNRARLASASRSAMANGRVPMLLQKSILAIFALLHWHGNVAGAEEPPFLLVLSFDGLGADFLNEAVMPNLWKLARQGAWAPSGIKAQVATVTAPNYYTIATGLYQENHGIIGNDFWDPYFGERYDYWNMEELDLARRSRDAKWYSGEPIWQTNEKAGRNSGGMRWPLCDIKLKNGTISRCFPWEDYGDLAMWMSDLDQLLFWFTDKKQPINLGFLYISEPDHSEHENDIFSPTVKAKLAELDAFVWNLIRKMKTLNLQDRLNIIFISDHGHANVYAQQASALINLDEIIDPADYTRSSLSIFPNTRRGVTAEDLYSKLQAARMKSPRFDVWWKHEFPDRYHYKNNRRIGPIILMERLGFAFASNNNKLKRPIFGMHGYSNDYHEMKPAFFAIGPAFKPNLTIDWEIENVDLYNLMCSILKLKPAPNDGNFTRVAPLLHDPYLEIDIEEHEPEPEPEHEPESKPKSKPEQEAYDPISLASSEKKGLTGSSVKVELIGWLLFTLSVSCVLITFH